MKNSSFYTLKELYTFQRYLLEKDEEVRDYLFHARRHNDENMEWCYKCNLDLLRTMRMEIDYEIADRLKDD
jgi:hypothetical protein